MKTRRAHRPISVGVRDDIYNDGGLAAEAGAQGVLDGVPEGGVVQRGDGAAERVHAQEALSRRSKAPAPLPTDSVTDGAK